MAQTATPLVTADLHAPVVDAALSAASEMLGMEVVFIGGLFEDEYSFLRVLGSIPGIAEGTVAPRSETLCHQMLTGAPHATANTAEIPQFAKLPPVTDLGVTSYVGVPIRVDDRIVGTLCGLDRGSIPVQNYVVRVLATLADIVAAHVHGDASDSVVIRRSPAGWRVGADDDLDLISAMSLADLLADSLNASRRPPRAGEGDLTEVERLKLAVSQLEHALSARVLVEQAIGVLAERQRLAPRDAFERLRKAARTRGRKVHDLAREVVASSTDPNVPLPPELGKRQSR